MIVAITESRVGVLISSEHFKNVNNIFANQFGKKPICQFCSNEQFKANLNSCGLGGFLGIGLVFWLFFFGWVFFKIFFLYQLSEKGLEKKVIINKTFFQNLNMWYVGKENAFF